MKRREVSIIYLSLAFVWLYIVRPPMALAEGSPAVVIDKTNWEEIEGLVPDSVLGWVKSGAFVLTLDELNFQPLDYLPAFATETLESNVGKYDLDEDGGIVEVMTGKPPKHIVGLPFPQVDENEPDLSVRIMYNTLYMQYLPGNLRFPFHAKFVGRSGFEREVGALWRQIAMDGYPGSADLGNPDGIEKYSMLVVKTPFDLAGTAIMLWRYRDPTAQDSTFGYFPAIRRVRRMSPANRSDAFVGTDFCIDDANGYDGKITAFEWRFLRKQEMLAPVLSVEPVRIVPNEKEEWETTRNIRPMVHGYEQEGWQGASWAPTDLAWVRRPAYVLEMRPKDSYYNYGVQHLWVDAEIFGSVYKVIHDRSGKYWKTFFSSAMACTGAGNRTRFISVATQQAVDDRREHSTVIEDASPRNIWNYYADLDVNDFSLAGFQKFNK
jgi:hypothetical protein